MDINLISKLSDLTGADMRRTFEALCDYVIGFFDPEGKPVEGWTYGKDVNKALRLAMFALVKEYKDVIDSGGWCDPLGCTFEQIRGRYDASKSGQFFTPESLCDLMADLVFDGVGCGKRECGAFGRRVVVADPSAGSGRNLIAFARRYNGKPREELPYFVAEDIAPLCCKMCAINLMMYGLPGEVVCHDTIAEPDSCRFGYIINETMFPFPSGIPSIRRFTDPMRFIALRKQIKPKNV